MRAAGRSRPRARTHLSSCGYRKHRRMCPPPFRPEARQAVVEARGGRCLRAGRPRPGMQPRENDATRSPCV
eukprot:402569-Pyramimonas_sp.AAC.1